MFTNISWSNYILEVTLLLAAWYLFVSMRFYSHDLQIFLARKRKPNSRATYDEFTGVERKLSEPSEFTAE
ncbi:MAG: hypothetical protein H0V14_05295, partial [Chitinophagaceae bacterium]|nr:hypothetical protein [Chitinophagaceae bacterium]